MPSTPTADLPKIASVPATGAAPSSDRLFSLDAYRGFVILMMIFVNYVGEMKGVPHWLRHASATEDTFTLPDLVFPGFLFMVGMAIPLAFARRLDEPRLPVLKKLFFRFVGLLMVGVVYENAWRYDESLALLPKSLFMTLFYAAVIVAWFQGNKKAWVAPAAVGVMVVLMFLFRGKVGDGFTTTYLEHTWWGILGLIGWGYALCTILYLATRGSGTALMGCLALMLCLYMGETKGLLDPVPAFIRNFVGIGAVLGSTAANVMLGVIAGRWFVPAPRGSAPLDASAAKALVATRIRNTLLFVAGLLAAGLLLRPFHGINKIMATESYTLVTGAINMAAFLAFYLVLDVWKKRAWAAFLVTVGTNALLAYILPDLWDKLLGTVGLGKLWWATAWYWEPAGGLAGILNGAGMTVFMIAFTVLLTRKGLKLKF